MINEERFRALCRKDQGGIEGARFQEALDKSPADPVPVSFEVGIDETKIIEISREDAQNYAIIAKEEYAPEAELLKCLKPEVHAFVKNNRSRMVKKLSEDLATHKGRSFNFNAPGNFVILWPLWTPDNVPVKVAEDYIRRYS